MVYKMIEIIKRGAPQYKANLHCHSTLSDGNLTPEELKAAYKAHGYSILAITNHEHPVDHSGMTEPDFLMLTGYEGYIRQNPNGVHDRYKPEVHINLFARDPHNTAFVCYNEKYCKYIKDERELASLVKVGSQRPREYTPEYVNEYVRTARENGYICAHNHAYWSMEDWEQIAAYEGFFSMEMCNYSSYVANHIEYNAQLYDWLLRRGKRWYCHSTDDNHNKHHLDSPGCDSFGGFTMILADRLEYGSVFSALEDGRFYSSMGPMIRALTVDGRSVRVETDPAVYIGMYDGGKFVHRAVGTADSPVTTADFVIPDAARYIRFSVADADGRHADTRAFTLAELGI